ncbi:MAG: TonB-dependent receptor plug domain-containing protein [Rhodospirillaceae bacterium]
MVRLSILAVFVFFVLDVSAVICQEVEEIKVSVRRLSDSLSQQIYSSVDLDQSLLKGPAFGLDDVLRRVPGFNLFRRQASRASHPTTHGVSLRGLGPNGAGRTLILLDNVPQNDPFGGWVEWSQLPPLFISKAKVIRGGGAGPWGNAALAGVVRLDSRVMNGEDIQADIRFGNKESLSSAAIFELDTERGTFFGGLHARHSNGYFSIDPLQRGAADQPLGSHSEGGRIGWRMQSSKGTVWSLAGSVSTSSLINGSEVARAETRTFDVSVTGMNDSPSSNPAWQSSLYLRHKDFESIFGAFDETRDNVRPVLNQFDVPATMVGGSVLLRWQNKASWTLESGADFRLADGETNERFRNLGAGFTRSRKAGGEQFIAGAFLEGHLQAARTLFTIGWRVDRWQQYKGQRKENSLETGTILVDRTFSERGGWISNGRLGARVEISQEVIFRASIYSGFRIPTLNELYRPFRVGKDITEANHLLRNEHMVGTEVGVDWNYKEYTVIANVFRNDLYNPVANTTITTVPGFNSEFRTFIPSGGSLRQRQNLGRVQTWGAEIDAILSLSPLFDLRAGYMFSNPVIKKSLSSQKLIGNRLAQVARHQATLQLRFQPTFNTIATIDLLASSRQFEDDQNLRQLDSFMTVNAQFAYNVSQSIELYLAAENIFGTRVEAGRSAAGLVTYGAPAFLWVGIRLAY